MLVPLKAVKQNFDMEEYSLSQATLEQVSFLSFKPAGIIQGGFV